MYRKLSIVNIFHALDFINTMTITLFYMTVRQQSGSVSASGLCFTGSSPERVV